MTQVIPQRAKWAMSAVVWAALVAMPGPAPAQAAAEPASVLPLYRQLRSAALDPDQVYVVRQAYIDREDIRIHLLDGTIAFLRAVDGRITGAFFAGEGDILVMPPTRSEREHLGLFTGAAILQERFANAFFRFNDDLRAELQPALRRKLDGAAFVAERDAAVQVLAEADALRLLQTFLHSPQAGRADTGDRFFHARIGGIRLGFFEVYLDTALDEQIWAGQVSYSQGTAFLDRWLSFPMRSARRAREDRDTSASQPGSGGDDQRLRVLGYQIRARVTPPAELSADAVLRVRTGAEPLRMAVFELSRNLRVTAVESGGRALEVIQNEALEGSELARRGNDLVAVVFPEAVAPRSSLQLRFTYAGSVLSDAGGGLLYVGARGVWYPNLGMSPADFDLEFQFPPPWTLVATGRRVSQEERDGLQVARWVSDRPLPLAGFNLGRYLQATARAGAVTVEAFAARGVEDNFVVPQARTSIVLRPSPRFPAGAVVMMPVPVIPQPASNAQAVADAAARSIEFLTRRLGPFPYSRLTLSQIPGRISQGWPSLVFLSSYCFLTPQELERIRLSEYESILFRGLMQAHETAHQWWGDAVLWESYRDQWLLEALANYSALLQLEAERPAEFRAVLEHYRKELLRKGPAGLPLHEAGPVTLGLRLSSSKFPAGYDVVSYGRGTWLIHMLREMFRDGACGPAARGCAGRGRADAAGGSDAAFFRALRDLRQRFEDRRLSTAGLQQVLEEHMPPSLRFEGRRSLDWFFQEWVDATAVPELKLADVRFTTRAGKTTARGLILQQQAPETLVTSVPIYAEVGRTRVFVGRVLADGPETSFRLQVPRGARRLLLDPEKTILSRP